jgi:4-carboxymuconolactone decarboxylase
MTQHTRQSGAEIRLRVFGAPNGQPTPPGDPFLAPFFETAIEHVWGGVWNRPGLELKYRRLVVVSVLAALGQLDEIKPHIHGALKLGWSADELREALLSNTQTWDDPIRRHSAFKPPTFKPPRRVA